MNNLKELGKEYRRLCEVANNIGRILPANDERFQYTVKIIDCFDSVLLIENAFIEQTNDFILLFSEHNGYNVYMKEDLTFWTQYKRIEIEQLKE